MNRATSANGSIVPYVSQPFAVDFEVCWAGEFRAPDPTVPPLICFGSVDGKLRFSDVAFIRMLDAKGPASGSGEAVNGVARIGAWMAVSTCEEVSFWATNAPKGLYAPAGAHGVATTHSGCFVAPLGQRGILTAKPSGDDVHLSASQPDDSKLYVYRVLPLRAPAGFDVLACATRLGGFAAGRFSPTISESTMRTATFENIDVVDICALLPGTDSLAVAALGRDGSIILCNDVLNDRQTKTFRFQSIQGVAYRILCAHGDVYVLTSRGLFVLGRLAGRFTNREVMEKSTTPVMPLPLSAIDMNLAWGRWLLVVLGDQVLKFDVEQIHAFVPEHIGEGEIKALPSEPEAVMPEWSDVDATTTASMIEHSGLECDVRWRDFGPLSFSPLP